MKFHNLAGAVAVVVSSYGCGVLPEHAQELTEEQKEIVKFALSDAEALMPHVESLALMSKNAVDATGEQVNDNSEFIDAMYQTLQDAQYYYDNGQIYSYDFSKYNEQYGYATGMFVDQAHDDPQNYENDYILLDSEHPMVWDASLLMHEAGHRQQSHDPEFQSYISDRINEPGSLNGFDGEYAQKLQHYGDYPTYITAYFDLFSEALSSANNIREARLDIEADPESVISSWDSLSMYYKSMQETYEHWCEDMIDKMHQSEPQMDAFYAELGITPDELRKAVTHIDLYEYNKEVMESEWARIQEIHEEALKEYRQEQLRELTEGSRLR